MTVVVEAIDRLEHHLRELCRTLGWKTVFQTPLSPPTTTTISSSNAATQEQRGPLTLAQLRDLINGGAGDGGVAMQ